MSNDMSDSDEGHVVSAKSAGETSSKKVIWISALALLFAVVFCTSFVVFYTRNNRNVAAKAPVDSGKQLPTAELIDEFNKPLPESDLRKGRVVLVFVTADCDACQKESEFLKGLVDKRPDVRFYG